MEERAQSVGNAKIRGEFDMDAAMPVDPNTNQECLLWRLVEFNPAHGMRRDFVATHSVDHTAFP